MGERDGQGPFAALFNLHVSEEVVDVVIVVIVHAAQRQDFQAAEAAERQRWGCRTRVPSWIRWTLRSSSMIASGADSAMSRRLAASR